MTQGAKRIARVVLWAAGCLAGCASSGGPFFPGVVTPPRVQGHLYIYRLPVWYTAGARMPVRVGYVLEGELHDNSYLRIKLPPGWHIVDVNGIQRRMYIAAGRNHYLEYDVSRSTEGIAAVSGNTLATTLTERGELHLRDEPVAVRSMQGLRNARTPDD